MQTEDAKYGYLDFDYQLELPCLVLAVDKTPYFEPKKPDNFKYIIHQSAGLGCSQKKLFGMVLEPKDDTLVKMKLLCDKWLDSNVGIFGTRLDEINAYAKDLKTLFGSECQTSYTNFEEAVYPMDLTDGMLQKLAKNPPDQKKLDDLFEFEHPLGRLAGSINRYTLYILGENSD